MAGNMPAAEHAIDAELVRGLLADQHPDLAHLPLRELPSGWDNAIYRLGDELCVRLPRRAFAAPLARHEQRWLPELAPRLPLPIPAPLRGGAPGRGYPWAWSICPWLAGDVAVDVPAARLDLPRLADALAGFERALHTPAPADAPRSQVRGIPLSVRAAQLEANLAALGGEVDADAVRSAWERALGAAPFSGPPLWVHGDLHPGNLVLRDGRLAAVLDFGDLNGGDPACDLAVAWMLFPPELRGRFRRASGDVDDATWARARGWALYLAVALLASSADHPRMRRVGEALLPAVLGDPDV